MQTATLTNEGTLIIPKSVLLLYHWQEGQEILLEETNKGILLKANSSFPTTKLEDVAGCLKYEGKPKTLEDFEQAIQEGIMEQWCDSK